MTALAEQHPLSPRYGAGFGIRFFHAVIRLFGPGPAYAVLALVIPFYVYVLRRPRKLASHYLRHRFPGDSPVRRFFRTYAYIYHFGQVLIDQAAMGILGREAFTIDFPDREIMYRLSEGKKGVLLLTSHAGNWQTAMGTMDHLAKPVHFHLQLDAHTRGWHYFDLAGEREKIRFISPFSFMGGLVEAHGVLESGGILSMMGDRAWGSRTEEMTFLGEKAPFPVTPYRLALSGNAELVAFLTVRTGKLAFRIETSYLTRDMEALQTMPRHDAGLILMRRYVSLLESYVQKYPYMWFNIFDFWKSHDTGEKYGT